VAIETTITIDAVASATLDDLKVEPEVPIDRTHGETSGPLTYLTIFYPAELLRSETRYTVSVSVMGERAVWSFTTTSEPFEPGVRFYLAKNVLWISLFAASTATFTVGFVLSRKKWERREVAESPCSKPLRS
jgi:hypothetical protein